MSSIEGDFYGCTGTEFLLQKPISELHVFVPWFTYEHQYYMHLLIDSERGWC